MLLNAQSPWTQKASLSNVRLGHASVALDGKIYIVGGSYSTSDNRGSTLPLLEMYDPLTDSWTSKAEMDTGVAYVSCCVVNEKIWAVGGG